MSHRIATEILKDGNSEEIVAEILSTTIVLLGLSTALLGVVLILGGKFRVADAVAYLPLPGEYNSSQLTVSIISESPG